MDFSDIGFPDGYHMWEDTHPLIHDLVAPGVEVHCLYGTGIDTAERLIYSKTMPTGSSKRLNESHLKLYYSLICVLIVDIVTTYTTRIPWNSITVVIIWDLKWVRAKMISKWIKVTLELAKVWKFFFLSIRRSWSLLFQLGW